MKNKLIISILLLGIIYKLIMTSGGNFLFNMDNARDMVDVREMMVLGKLRLTGPTSAIEGLFNGPFWYYLLAIPFFLSGGDPYASILMEIILWVIGGFFLLKMISNWNKVLVLPIGFLWIASNYISLTTAYAFNPNPVTHLTPVFIFLLYKFLETGKLKYSASAWFIGGLFFNFEMNFGVFIPAVFLLSTIIVNRKLLKQKAFWLGSVFYIALLLPQVLFDLKHQFIMTNSVLNFLRNEPHKAFNFLNRFNSLYESFYNPFSATLFNNKTLTTVVLLTLIPVIFKEIKSSKRDKISIICLCYVLIPFMGYMVLPVSVNAWHLGGEIVAGIILTAFSIKKLTEFKLAGILVSLIISIVIIWSSISNVFNYFVVDRVTPNNDPSLYKNEIAAIDYVYKKAEGRNFKVYTYLPSVIDYPYQYLFWWHGKKQYGYIPGEYVYSPNKPQYISNKEKFDGRKDNFSGLVFLIKEPDRIKYRDAWEDDYEDMEFISKEMLGSIEVEMRKEIKK